MQIMLSRAPHDYSKVKLTEANKEWIGRQVVEKIMGPTKLARKYNLKVCTVKKYAYRVRRGLQFRKTRGKPPLLEKDDEIELTTWLKNLRYCSRSDAFRKRFLEIALSRHIARGHSPLLFRKPSAKAIAKYEEKMGIMTKNAEATTNARAEAVADLQNAISFAAMNYGIVPYVLPQLIVNCDATQFTVGSESGRKIQVKVLTKSECYKVLPDESNKGITAYFIKYYLIMNAYGQISHPIFVVADETMAEDTIDVYRVPCLSLSVSLESTGWLVFCKTRCCNLAFYRWLLKDMIVDFISLIKKHHQIDATSLAWFQLDGEALQIAPFNDSTILQVFHANNITVGKPPASTTSITQPCDVGPCFKSVKSALKKYDDSDVENMKFELCELGKIFDQHVSKSSTSKQMSARHQKLAKLGLLRVKRALTETINPIFVKHSFEATGIYPLSVDKMIGNCSKKVSLDEMSEIREKLPQLVKVFSRQGELLAKDFNIFGSFVTEESKNKDNLVLNHRRSVILTSKALIARELAKLEEKENEILKKQLWTEHKKKVKAISDNTPIVLKFTKVGAFLK